MIVARSISELRAALVNKTPPVGFVPTMGALHEGHLTLMREARSAGLACVTSIFVNPTQFGPNEDFKSYPRHPEEDQAKCESVGVDVLFVPSVEDVYSGSTTEVVVRGVTEKWEGEFRPFHFNGVATVVAKLFGMVGPCRAYFGLKDLQQCAVIRRMVEDLHFAVDLQFVETVREADGVAMSSRNAYFSADQRSQIGMLPLVLRWVCEEIAGESEHNTDRGIGHGIQELTSNGWTVDYMACVDPETMEPLANAAPTSRMIVAARKFGIRLIDNMPIFSQN